MISTLYEIFFQCSYSQYQNIIIIKKLTFSYNNLVNNKLISNKFIQYKINKFKIT